MTEHYHPDDDLFSYEDFEDIDELAWDPDAVEPIDLAELDNAGDQGAPSDAAEQLLERIETLDDDIPPSPAPAPAQDPRLVDDEDGEDFDAEAEDRGDEEPDQEEPAEEQPPTQERTIRIGGRARMQRLPLGPPPPVRPPVGHRDATTGAAPAALPAVVYRLVLTLPPELGAEVLELRELGEIDDMPPPGIDLGFAFRTADLDAVESAIASWARAHLPLELAITEIVAEIIGAQQYVAAWLVEPHAALSDVQIALKRALAPAIAPVPESSLVFQPRVIIGAHVPARTYPLVIGQMQRDFTPYAWQAGSVALFRAASGADPGAWELARAFGSPTGRG